MRKDLEAEKVLAFLKEAMGVNKIRFETSVLVLSQFQKKGQSVLFVFAIQYAINENALLLH